MRSTIVCLAVVAVAASFLVAQAPSPTTKPAVTATASAPAAAAAKVVFDASGVEEHAHVRAVDDPFGGKGKVAMATAGSKEQHLTINGDSLFKVPADKTGKFIVTVGVTGPTAVRILLTNKDTTFSQRATLPAEGKWCDVEVPVAPVAEKLGAEATVIDISIFQADPDGKGKLYLKSISLAK